LASLAKDLFQGAQSMMKKLLALSFLLWVASIPLAVQAWEPLSPQELALMEAAYNGKLENVQSLLADGVKVDALDEEKRTSLMLAAFNGQAPVVKYLVEKGAKLELKDSNGRTALLYASSGSFPETVEFLLKSGADVNVQGTAEGFTALMTASAEGLEEIVRLLLSYGANPDIKDRDGDTAGDFARQKGHSSIVALLEKSKTESVDTR
jgi:ankyrin repeat protein